MADSDLTAELARAKRIADGLQFACRLPDRKPGFTACGGPAAEAYWEYFTPARIASLLAAIEAPLKLAADWDAEAERAADRADIAHENGEDGSFHMHSTRCVTLDYCLTAIREVISREITGKGES